ncbi:MAG: hypothetical protein ACFFE2_14865 [Candidatus Thorarchaeota archaeon]
MKKKITFALLIVFLLFNSLSNQVNADQPTADNIILEYDFSLQELTVSVVQCTQVLCQLSENYVSQIAIYKVSVPTDVFLEERNYTKPEQAWVMSDSFHVNGSEGDQLKVQVSTKDSDDAAWPVVTKYITISNSTHTVADSPGTLETPNTIPMKIITQIAAIGGIILIFVIGGFGGRIKRT